MIGQSQTISIIGAGLVGRLLSWRLLVLGHQVQLIEKSPFDRQASAAHTAAAMISPMSEVVISERSIYDMGMRSLQIWPEWLEQLNSHVRRPIHYRASGSIVVAHPADETELEQFYADLNHHLGSDNRAQWLDKASLRSTEPDIAAQFERALYLPHEAYLDNRQLLDVLLAEIKHMGGRCVDLADVTLAPTVTCSNPQISLVDSDIIVDCRGVGAKDLNQNVRGVRGEVLWVQTKEVCLQHPIRLMHPRYKLYVVPKPDHRFIIGATEIESQDCSPVSVQSMLELCSALYTLNPAFAEARILELDANLRPSLWDNLPLISEHTTYCEGLAKPTIAINGLYRHGYLLAPYLIEQLLNNYFQPETLN